MKLIKATVWRRLITWELFKSYGGGWCHVTLTGQYTALERACVQFDTNHRVIWYTVESTGPHQRWQNSRTSHNSVAEHRASTRILHLTLFLACFDLRPGLFNSCGLFEPRSSPCIPRSSPAPFAFSSEILDGIYDIYPTRCNVTQFILSGNCSTCFGWYLHPSSGAQTPVSTAPGICHTVTTTYRYSGR